MRLLLLALLSLPLCAVEAHRVRCEGKTQTFGTACVVGGKVLTAAHVLESSAGGMNEPFVETENGWIRCKVEDIDRKRDVAILKPAIPIPDTKPGDDGIFASTRGEPVKRLKFTWQDGRIVCQDFTDGGSGAPVYEGGKLLGLAIARGEYVVVVPVKTKGKGE